MPSNPLDLDARLRLLEEEREILRLLYTYGQAIDYGDEERWLDCFTEDGAFLIESRLPDQLKRNTVGREALRAFIAGHTRAPERWHKHFVVEPLIEIDGDTATCTSYLFVLMDHEERPTLRVMGRYLDTLVKEADGRWRFKQRIGSIESMRADLPPFVDGRPARL
jgi:ketosteroid isomerase-like protein